jgi:hypothetical protein
MVAYRLIIAVSVAGFSYAAIQFCGTGMCSYEEGQAMRIAIRYHPFQGCKFIELRHGDPEESVRHAPVFFFDQRKKP